VKVFVGWTLGLAVFLGSPAVTLALDNFVAGQTYCSCACRISTGKNVILDWEKTQTCTLSNGKDCKGKVGNKFYPGTLHGCA
jgi:hypothetical protein